MAGDERGYAHPIPRDLAIRYAGASRDFNPIHLFQEDAEAAGFRKPVLHGMCVLAWVAHDLERAAARPLTALSARFASPAYVGDEIHIRPEPREDHWIASVSNAEGDTVIKQIRGYTAPVPLPDDFPEGGPQRVDHATISASKIRELRQCVGHGGSECLAPPTFAAVACQRTVFALLDEPEVDMGAHGSIHTAQKLFLQHPLKAGQQIEVRAGVVDDITRRGLRRVTVRSRIESGGALSCVADWVLTRRL